MKKFSKKIAITTGDPNGIGAEITIKALKMMDLPKENILIISNRAVLDFYGELDKNYEIVEIPFEQNKIIPGKLSADCGEFSFKSLKKACDMAKNKEISAVVTAPVSKEALHLAGHNFNGQTEILQEFLANAEQKAEMLFVARDFRVLLLTRHVAIKDLKLNKEKIINQIKNLDIFFKNTLNIKNPKFALCSFNPHAGEGGVLGQEEIKTLTPAAKELKASGINITEPLPADILFIKASKPYLSEEKNPYDCYIATYHDQGLIPIKTLASDKTVNMTIGLNVVRTSPAHGTAFDIASKNVASESSMVEAIEQVLSLQ